MLLLSPAYTQATESRRQDLLAAAATARLIASGDTGTRRPGAVAGLLHGIASALGRAAAFIPDSREAIRSKEQNLAALGVTWTTDSAHERELAAELRAGLARRAAAPPRYPTLAAIDRARAGARPGFAAAANAADLERRARELTDRYWSDWDLLTGRIPAAAFERVCAALESARVAAEHAAPPVIAEVDSEPDAAA
jgi:hypothetical protein